MNDAYLDGLVAQMLGRARAETSSIRAGEYYSAIKAITYLRAELAKAREALERIRNHRYDAGGAYEMCKIARAALEHRHD